MSALQKKAWIFSTYFAEGFPFSVIRSSSGVFFRDSSYSLTFIGYTSLFGIPWIIKFFWAHLIDINFTKKKWLLGAEFLLAIGFALFSLTAIFKPDPLFVFLLFFLTAFIAATHDIAIDGYYLTALCKEDQERFVGLRVLAYRLAMITGSGVIISIGTNYSWPLAYILSALFLTLFFLWHRYFLPEIEKSQKWNSRRELLISSLGVGILLALFFGLKSEYFLKLKTTLKLPEFINFTNLSFLILLGVAIFILGRRKKNLHSRFHQAFLSFLDQQKIFLFVLFIVLVRCGEYMLSTMVGPLIVDLGIKKYYGILSGFTGLPLSIAGALLGGYIISKKGLGRTAFPFLCLQNITNLIYALLALYLQPFIKLNTANPQPQFIGTANLLLVIVVNSFDQFASGLGTAVLSIILMQLCKKEFRSMHFAIGSGLMAGGGMISGVLSGYLASSLGYSKLFLISFLISLPAMFIIFALPLNQQPSRSEREQAD